MWLYSPFILLVSIQGLFLSSSFIMSQWQKGWQSVSSFIFCFLIFLSRYTKVFYTQPLLYKKKEFCLSQSLSLVVGRLSCRGFVRYLRHQISQHKHSAWSNTILLLDSIWVIILVLSWLAFSYGLRPDLKLVPAGGYLALVGIFSRFAQVFYHQNGLRKVLTLTKISPPKINDPQNNLKFLW